MDNPRILLLHPFNIEETYHYAVPQVALGYLSGALKDAGFNNIDIRDCHVWNWDVPNAVAHASLTQPKLIGIRLWSHQLALCTRLIAGLRQVVPDATIVLGGPHPTCAPRYLDSSGADYAFQGEAEDGIVGLAKHLFEAPQDLAKIPGLVWRSVEDGRIRANPMAKEKDLDRYRVDWDLLDLPRYHAKNSRTPSYDHGRRKNGFIFTTRGCPYPCTYCAAGLTNGKQIRSHSAAYSLDTVEYLYNKYGIRHFNIMDDNFTFYKDVVMEFCEELMGRKDRLPGISFHNPNGVRVDRLDDEMLAMMRRCGWEWLHIGIESGSPATLEKMRKKLKLHLCTQNIAKIREHGMKCWGFFILGYLDETREDIETTINYAIQSRLNAATFSLFTPIPGTAVFDQLVAAGRIPEDFQVTAYQKADRPVFAQGVTNQDLMTLQRKALLRFYGRPDRAIGLLRGMSPQTFFNRLKTTFLTRSGTGGGELPTATPMQAAE
ncbi:MAG: B12-binding domain-containing radical SAM protein [Rhodospirillaceae bacterium]